MAKIVIMPKFGFSQEEATIVRWLKQAGDKVEQGDPLCEVTTDKINMEVEAPVNGILAGLKYAEGDVVPVTNEIAVILAEGESLPQASPAAAPAAAAVPEAAQAAAPAAAAVEATPLARRMAAVEGVDLADLCQGTGPGGKVTSQDVRQALSARPAAAAAPTGKLNATPAARRLADEYKLDIRAVAGSGLQGRVQGSDVQALFEQKSAQQAAVQAPAAPAAPVQAALVSAFGAAPQIIPLEGIRKVIAQRMQASAQEIPSIQLAVDVDMTRCAAFREALNPRSPGGRTSLSMTALIVKACANALKQQPMLNSYLQNDKIYVFPELHIGVAVSLDSGLIVPVVHDAGRKGVNQIGDEVADLSARARANKLLPDDVAGGTFTISNLGMFGIDSFTAMINPPQVAILAVGRIVRRFVPDEHDQPVVRSMMNLSLSADHRVIDGALAARFLAALRDQLESPNLLLE